MTGGCMSGLFCEGLANSPSDDRVFTGLQHPDPNHERIRIRRDTLVGLLAGVRVQFDRRRSRAQSLDDLASCDAGDCWIEAYEEMWNMVGNLWNHRFRPDRRDALDGTRDEIDPLLVVTLHRHFRLRKNPVDRRNHANNLFLRYLHAAADPVSRIIIRMGQVCQDLSAQQKTRVLWTKYSFDPGKSDKVETHAGVFP